MVTWSIKYLTKRKSFPNYNRVREGSETKNLVPRDLLRDYVDHPRTGAHHFSLCLSAYGTTSTLDIGSNDLISLLGVVSNDL